MKKFALVTHILSIAGFATCALYSLYANIFPERITVDSLYYNLGTAITWTNFAAVWCINISYASVADRHKKRKGEYCYDDSHTNFLSFENLRRFKLHQKIFLIMLLIYVVYRKIIANIYGRVTAGDNANGEMIMIAFLMMIHYYLIALTKGVLKSYSNGENEKA